ncbi:AEC family transporter [Alkalicoccobacillus porphyridii]|uniref:AEC family transporter n=1 Tax=Alkalicoccobacillus porphyridii TaxID=2597270 RepID=A0A554A0T3_9BACI|nr:AEC family transporter [Alkalicoccobacillus porphyridii]TSB47300.1 AEC family transporter [Alkalicoccobacillus porphyridii]
MWTFLIEITIQVMLPIFVLLIAGALLHRKFSFHLATLSKLLTYFFLPVVVFVNISNSQLDGGLLLEIGGFLIIQFVILALLSWGLVKLLNIDRKLAPTFQNSIVLMNSGNFGLPVSQLVFAGNPLGISIQVIVLMFQNLITYTYGVMVSASTRSTGLWSNLAELIKTPIIYALVLGLIFYQMPWELPAFIQTPMQQVSNGFIALALLVLGAQIAYPSLKQFSFIFFVSIFGRLIAAPLIGLVIIWLMGLDGTVAQGLLIASSFPMSRNSALFALEYDNHPEYAAQAVLISTIASCITVTFFIYLSQALF